MSSTRIHPVPFEMTIEILDSFKFVLSFGFGYKLYIVFIWSQYDGGNIDKEQWLRFPPKTNEAKLNIMRRRLY